MQGKHNFIFSLDGEQKSFFVSNLDVASFCRLIRSAFQVDKTITALQDAQGNICDLHYFCNNLHAHKDKFYIILTEQRKAERQSRKSHKSKNSRVLTTNDEPSYYVEFGAFLQEIQQIRFSPQHPVLTIVLVFDNEYQAGIFGQPIVMRIYKTFAFLQAYYTIIQEEESDSLLLTVFENQILKHEMEMKINHSVAEDVCYQIEQLLCEEEEPEPILQGSFATPNSNANNNIPLIVTRGNEKQILQVEANDNFHSSQGKRTHGVKKAVDKFRNRFESREYEYLLGLIIGQDQSVFAAYQLFQKQQDDENFIRNLKSLLPQEDNNNLSFQNNLKFITSPSRSDLHQSVNFPYDCNPTPGLRSTVTIMEQLLSSGDLDSIESGMLRELRMDSDLDDLVKSLMEYPQDVLLQIIRQYLQSLFQQEITKNFNSHQVEYFLQENANKQNPIYEGFQRFGQNGQLQELFLLLKDNVGQLEQQLREENSYSYYLMHKRRKDSQDEHFHFHLNLPQVNQQEERKLSVDSQVLESKKEINFIDRYHVKVLQKYSNEDYEKLFMTVYDQCSKFCDEHEKAKLHGFYTAQNQRLLEILDKYGQRYDIDCIKSDINDLLTLQNKKIDEIPSPTHGAVIEPKMHKYQNFKFIINFLYEIDKVITLRQAKAFYYLYSIEDMSVMAAYEVYCETKEQDEFLNTLNLIFKVYSSSSRFDFNEIEQFDSLIEQQLTILFAYRRCLNQEQRLALEQNMISDNTLLKLFRDFLRQRDQRVFIQKLSDFANSQIEKQKDNQSMDPYMKKIDQNNQHKDLIKDICAKFLKTKVKQIDLLMDAIDKDNIMLKSSLEVYDYNLDKQDLVENIQLIYNYILKSNVKSILKANLIELGRSKTDVSILVMINSQPTYQEILIKMSQFLKERLNCISKLKMKQNSRILLVEYSNLAIFDYYYFMYKVELVDSSEFKDRQKYYKHLLQTYCQWSFLKYFVYSIIWLIGGRISIHYSMQGLYVIITGFALIFTNLGTREKGTLSAYSIFNKGYKKLMGQMTEEDVANMYNMGGVKKKEDLSDDDDDKISKDFEGLSMEQMMAKLTKLGNKLCFCNSGKKYKKCHYYIHQRIKQQEDEERRKGIKKN